MSETEPLRYAPETPFPPYAFVPNQHPHPTTDPIGHGYGKPEVLLPVPVVLTEDSHFRFAVDLFNHGYYWEAHEAWELHWIAYGRRGAMADLVKGLIRLAAAGVKAREGNSIGVGRHAEAAKELFVQTQNDALREHAEKIAQQLPNDSTFTVEGNPVLGIQLNINEIGIPR